MVDPGYSVDLGRFAGAAFLDSKTLIALGENKSYVILRESDSADSNKNFRYFLESFDRFDEVSRSRLSTVRARMMYVMSLAFDPMANALYTVTVPNSKFKRLVVSRFDRSDLVLSEEFSPMIAPGRGLRFSGERRSLDELFVTGASVADGRMYAISAAYGMLLIIDLNTHAVIAAYTVPGLDRPTGIAIKGSELYIVNEDAIVSMVGRP